MNASLRKWFNDLSIGTRLAGLVCVALLAVIITAFAGMTSNRRLAENTASAYRTITRPLAAVANARGAFNAMRTGLYDLAQDFNTSEQNVFFKKHVLQNLLDYEYNIQLYKEILDIHGTSDSFEKETVDELAEQLASLRHSVENTAAVAEKTGRGADAVRMLRGVFLGAAVEVSADLTALTKILEAQTKSANDYAVKLHNRNNMLSLLILGSSALFLLLIAYVIVNSIIRPMKEMRTVAERLSEGRLDVHIAYSSKNEIGILADSFRHLAQDVINITKDMQTMAERQSAGDIEYFIDTAPYKGSYRSMANGINTMMRTSLDDLLTIVQYLGALARGDFAVHMNRFPGKKAVINDHLDEIYNNLRAALSEIDTLVKNAANGKLGTRVNAEQYAGDWRALMDELNTLLNALILPINETTLVLSQIADGNFDARVTGDYKGDIARIKNAVNATAAGISTYLQAKLAAERSALESRLAKSRAEAAHAAVMSGIKYASKIQNNLRPSKEQFAESFADFSVIWEPRDIVGGDIYWMKNFDGETVLCVCDCTGHGTPGSLLTMLVVSALDTLVNEATFHNPAEIMWRLDHRLADILNVYMPSREDKCILDINDGCDLAILRIARDGTVSFASSNIHVFICNGLEVQQIKGQKLRIGDGVLTEKSDVHVIDIPPDSDNAFYIASDGLYDQVGGQDSRPFGYAAMKDIILKYHGEKQKIVSGKIWEAFEAYRGAQQRRDDVQLITFKLKME